MKKFLSYKIAVTLFLWSFVFCALNAQSEPSKLYSASAGIGIYSPITQESVGGLSMNLDVAVKLSDEIFSVYFHSGNSDQFIYEESFLVFSINYGRSLNLSRKWLLEGHLGIGYMRQKNSSILFDFEQNDYVDHAISFPFRPKVLYRLSDVTSIGINPNFNLNGIQAFYALDFIFQFNF